MTFVIVRIDEATSARTVMDGTYETLVTARGAVEKLLTQTDEPKTYSVIGDFWRCYRSDGKTSRYHVEEDRLAGLDRFAASMH